MYLWFRIEAFIRNTQANKNVADMSIHSICIQCRRNQWKSGQRQTENHQGFAHFSRFSFQEVQKLNEIFYEDVFYVCTKMQCAIGLCSQANKRTYVRHRCICHLHWMKKYLKMIESWIEYVSSTLKFCGNCLRVVHKWNDVVLGRKGRLLLLRGKRNSNETLHSQENSFKS